MNLQGVSQYGQVIRTGPYLSPKCRSITPAGKVNPWRQRQATIPVTSPLRFPYPMAPKLLHVDVWISLSAGFQCAGVVWNYLLLFGAFPSLWQVGRHVVCVHEEASPLRECHVIGICFLPLQVEMKVAVEGYVQPVDIAT